MRLARLIRARDLIYDACMSKLLDTLDTRAHDEAMSELITLRTEHPAYPDYELLLYANARARQRATMDVRDGFARVQAAVEAIGPASRSIHTFFEWVRRRL